jgi:hypothetical protein
MGVCADCHAVKMTQWASPGDLHALPAADVLTYSEDGGATFPHNTAELLNDNCVKCHSMFQAPLGITHFVNPAGYDTSGLPMYCAEDVAGLIISGTSTTCTAGNIYQGPWTLSNTADWQATKCQVCHDPLSTSPAKLAKYGAMLDQPFDPSYIDLSAASQALYPDQTWLATPYQYVFDGTSAYVQTNMTAGNAVGLTANKLCSSGHDPDDQGGDPNAVVGAVDYGPQGGDSRAYVTASHAGMTCVDCHQTHDFTPADPALTSSCSTSTCHGSALPAGPGKVHTNHL